MAIKPPVTPKTNSSKKPAARFGEPEKRNWRVIIPFAIFVVLGLGACVWLYHKSPRMGQLDCGNSGMGSMTSFGGCHED